MFKLTLHGPDFSKSLSNPRANPCAVKNAAKSGVAKGY
jgi:hypothetical protein